MFKFSWMSNQQTARGASVSRKLSWLWWGPLAALMDEVFVMVEATAGERQVQSVSIRPG